MVKTLYTIFFLIVIFSCNKDNTIDCTTYDFSDCNGIEPTYADINITITKQEKNSKIPIWLYKGKYGDSEELMFFDTVSEVNTKINVHLNCDYYAKAKYEKDGNVIFAIDGAYLKKVAKTICDSTCWKIKGDAIDLRLKN